MKRALLILFVVATLALLIWLPKWIQPAPGVHPPQNRAACEAQAACDDPGLLAGDNGARDSDKSLVGKDRRAIEAGGRGQDGEPADGDLEAGDAVENIEEVEEESFDAKLKQPSWERGAMRRNVIVVRLYGNVVDHNGLPVPAADIMVDGFAVSDLGELPPGMTAQPINDGFDETSVATTDADGCFDVRVALPVSFEDLAFAQLDVLARGRFGDSNTVQYEWYDDKEPAEINLVLPEQGGIEGRVVDPFGVGAEHTAVHVFPEDRQTGKHLTFTRTEPTGNYRIVGLKPGKYALLIKARQWTAPRPALIVEVFAGVVSPVEEIVVEPRRRLVVTVRLDGEPYSGEFFEVGFYRDDELVGEDDYFPTRSGRGEIPDPPPEATRMIITLKKFEDLEIILPDLADKRLYDLGTFNLTPAK